ncbi:MAG: DNA-processing protein DprA [Acidimicrobiales bacterium]
MSGDAGLPAVAFVAALGGLPDMGPGRLRAVLALGEPAEVWDRVRRGAVPAGPTGPAGPGDPRPRPEVAERFGAVVAAWVEAARTVEPAAVWDAHRQAGVGIAVHGHAAYPAAFVDDPAPPPVLFWLGDADAVVGTRVAVVGTRRCTAYGREVAQELGADLSRAGVAIVSGLALGVDAAAHRGALAVDGAPPIAVVGSGLDVVYPRRNRELWAAVAERGVVFSEYPLGTPPHPWRFPSRNRLVAALGDALVVVESRATGGSMHTVREAERRSRPVLAVPGPVRSAASAGTNQLLSEGVAVARDATDVLVRMGLESVHARSAAERRPPPSTLGERVLDAVGWQPTTLEQVVVRTGLALTDAVVALDDLVRDGWVDESGGWFERAAKPGG